MESFCFYLTTLCVLLSFTCMNSQQTKNCTSNSNCGTNSKCINKSCTCEDGFKKHGTSCIDEKCEYGKCYKCKDTKCQRCVNYIMEDSRKCVDTCSTKSSFQITKDYEGKVCKASKTEKKLTEAEIIGIVTGVVLAVIIVVVIFPLVCYFKSSDEIPSNQRRPEQSRSGDNKNQINTTRQPTANEAQNEGFTDDTNTSQDVEKNNGKHVAFQRENKDKDVLQGTSDDSQAIPRPERLIKQEYDV